MQTLGRIFWLFVLSLAWLFAIEKSEERDHGKDPNPEHHRYYAYFPNTVLPWTLGCLVLLPGIPILRDLGMGKQILAMCFIVFLHMSVYYVLLAMAMPLIRRYCNARVCATLWLLPNYLYLICNNLIAPNVPKWTIYVPDNILLILVLVWAVGFLAVLGWKVLVHFRFRRYILEDAAEVTDPAILAIWQDELNRAGYAAQKPYMLVCSPAVATPLTVGFRKKSIRVVLPQRSYTPEELRLIFRHEIVHIGRDDSGTKFFFAFCTAMCWFNPLMWWAMRRSADDLELSCDETVLLEADEGQRRQYADLLLRTAGDERGFTTCLSASARALRYRLHWVVNPVKRFTGSFLAGAILFGLMFTCGHVTLAFDQTTGADLIFAGESPALYELDDNEVFWINRYVGVKEPEALKDYLAGLEICDVSGLYELEEGPREIRIFLDKDGESIRVTLSDHVMRFRGHGYRYESFYVEDEIDWDYLERLLWLEPSRG